ncbi:hypothetical protein VOLCADRAFT_95254 [Volvox carteri f. nagariensis]|uniref:Uncharacterized protein n=1 Tax=Volvox carteri f. nagariensis TaxID=3068 RepID=D8U707_VOLCA|nr:uncharacterized protein VOLCADRAFT_95254 [Volvox carteri f. nagariensis]EFJ44603.1 hypothetical protein VOLCADRAFT_95254 [Volvox carteri f. nagariensis]|eukprot:XP_002954453.1 hypothetical protein VOLCADRAFT_95254 [Volvox carteri f. nagariensis]
MKAWHMGTCADKISRQLQFTQRDTFEADMMNLKQQQQTLPQPLPQQFQPQPQPHQLLGGQGPHGTLQGEVPDIYTSSFSAMGMPAIPGAPQLQQPQPPASGRTFGNIFPQRQNLKPASGTPSLPQQPQQRVFPSPPPPPPPSRPPVGAKLTLPAAAAPVEDVLPPSRDMQPLQEFVGGNWLFVVFLPYFIATALQDTHLRIGLIIGAAGSGVVFMAGLLVFPHILEMLMPIIFVVQLGVSYHSTAYEEEIIRTYPFITHSALAGVCLVSMIICYPVGYQIAQELVHKMYMTNPAVHRVGLYTTAVLTASLVSSCLLYLAPVCKGYDDRHFNALNVIFRLIYPCLATFLALLFMRFFPDVYLPNFSVVHGLNRKPPNRVPIYLVDPRNRTPPAILDASMFQTTVDAVAKAPPLTPRYSPGGYSPGGTAGMVPYPSAGHGIGTGADGVYGSGGVGGGIPRVVPGGDGEPHSVYTYYAAGPYGVNLPLRSLAADRLADDDYAPVHLPPLPPPPPLRQHLDAIVTPLGTPDTRAPSGGGGGGYYAANEVLGPTGGAGRGGGGGLFETSYYPEGLPHTAAASTPRYRLGSQQQQYQHQQQRQYQQQARLAPGYLGPAGGGGGGGGAPAAAGTQAAGAGADWTGSGVVFPPPLFPPGADAAQGSAAGYGLEAEQLQYDVQQSYQPYGGMQVPQEVIGMVDRQQQVSYQDDGYGLAAETEVAESPLPLPLPLPPPPPQPLPRASVRVSESRPNRSRSPLGIQRTSRLAAAAAPLGSRREESFGLDAELGG